MGNLEDYKKDAHTYMGNAINFARLTELSGNDQGLLVSLLRDFCIYGEKHSSNPQSREYLFETLKRDMEE